MAEYLEVFEYFGQDKNGRISTKQLRQAMLLVGLNPTDSQIQNLINEKEYDGKWLTNNSNVITGRIYRNNNNVTNDTDEDKSRERCMCCTVTVI